MVELVHDVQVGLELKWEMMILKSGNGGKMVVFGISML